MNARFPLYLLLALMLPLAACESETTTVEDDAMDGTEMTDDMADDGMMDDGMDDGMMADSAAADGVTAQATLDAVTAAGGLTQLAPGAAVDNINAWITRLNGVEGGEGVVAGLETLRDQLTAETLDGAAIGQTLSSLGEQTTALAGDDAALQQLGAALSQAGQTLAGGA